MANKISLVPYRDVEPGWEAVRNADDSIDRWSVWAFKEEESEWSDEIRLINSMQSELGDLDDETRKIRAQIASLVPCDAGLPITTDEILRAIGAGRLDDTTFFNGCWKSHMWWTAKMSRPDHKRSMQTVQAILTGYLDGKGSRELRGEYPVAATFIDRTYDWLGHREELSDYQKLLMKRLLLPFEFWTEVSVYGDPLPQEDVMALYSEVDGNSGRGAAINAEIAALGEKVPNGIPHKHAICECHHNTFRFLEKWLHFIGTAKDKVPGRTSGTERERLGRTLFSYALALDKWSLDVPMEFLLLDLGHKDLGFDPTNDIIRTYGYLGGERTPVKKWLAACLWHALAYNPIFMDPDYTLPLGSAQQALVERATESGVSIRDWIDSL